MVSSETQQDGSVATLGRVLYVSTAAERRDVVEALSHAGFEVVQADDGKSALASVTEKAPNVVLTRIGEDEAVDLIKRLRGDASTAHLPVIVQVDDERQLDKLIGAGATDLLAIDATRELFLARVTVQVRNAKELQSIREGALADEFFENNPFPYFLVRGGGVIHRVNSRFSETTGYLSADLDGKQIEDLLSREHTHELYGYHRQKLRYRDKTFEYEANIVHKGGHEIRVVLTMNIVLQGGYGLGALRDVTEERRLQREVEERNQQLEESSTRLKEAQEELTRTTQLATLGEVSGQVAHEILNPLTAVAAKTKALLEGMDTLQELKQYLEGIAPELSAPELAENKEVIEAIVEAMGEYQNESQGALSFVALELARIQRLVDDMRAATPADRVAVSLQVMDVLRYAQEVMSDPLEKAKVTLTTDCPEDVWVTMDRGELIQVFSNLIRNSIEALIDIPDQTVRFVKIVGAVKDDMLTIRVSDSGPGIPEAVKPLVFEPTCTTKRGGTGLGLPISRRFVRSCGGDLVLDETSSKGSTFVITLPCEIREEAKWEG